MGAVHYSLDPRLAGLLRDTLGLEVFVETGTARGDTVAAMRALYPEIHTVERDEWLYEDAVRRFAADPAVHLSCGDSGVFLSEIARRLDSRPVFYWLDAHATGQTPSDGPECPLLQELAALTPLNGGSVVAIDDARLFLGPPPAPRRPEAWPTLAEVLGALRRTSQAHEPVVIDDVLLFVPRSVAGHVREFAHRNGFDWLQAADKARQYDALLHDARTKEAALQEKEAALEKAHRDLEDVRDQRRREQWHAGRQRWHVRLSPKLGVLEHHPPRPIEVPERYHRTRAAEPVPVISLVTPSFGQGRFLERTLRSVLDQGYPRLEYVLQDGGSTDATPAVLDRYRSRLTRCVSAPDRGQAHALNLGFAGTTGEVMAYVNSDDLLLPGALHAVAAAFAEDPAVDIVYGHRVVIDEEDREIGRWVLPPHDDRVLGWADYIPQETLFWRRRIWEETGSAFDESFRFALDWDLLLRFQSAGARFRRLPRFLGAFRVHRRQKTSAHMDDHGLEEMDRLRRRQHGRPVTAREVHRHVRGYLARHVVLHKMYRLGLVRY
jgi:GT2 family glycosyltransferase